MKYGYSFTIGLDGIWIMINGRMYSVFKGLNTGKWQVSIYDNIWRKRRMKCP
jgi:hypothetical protein